MKRDVTTTPNAVRPLDVDLAELDYLKDVEPKMLALKDHAQGNPQYQAGIVNRYFGYRKSRLGDFGDMMREQYPGNADLQMSAFF